MARITLATLALIVSWPASGHSGGLDRCGGHNDRKQGGYHVHNAAKYCACHPTAAECKKLPEPKPSRAR